MERTCKKCGETKPIEEFKKDKTYTFGYRYTCLKCVRKQDVINREKYKDKRRESSRSYREKNREYLIRYSKAWYKLNKERYKDKSRERGQQWRKLHKERIRQVNAQYVTLNKDEIKQKAEVYRKLNRDHVHLMSKQYRLRNADKLSQRYKVEFSELKDRYVIGVINGVAGLSFKTIREHPELIENYRKQIELKRLIKTMKNESTTNS